MTAWDITCKDLKLLVKDRRALVLLLLLPLMFISILGMSTGQFLTGGGDERKMKIGVIDDSDSEYSHALLKTLESHEEDVVIVPQKSLAEARIALEKNDVGVLLRIAANYETLVDDIGMRDILNTTESEKTKSPEAMGLTFESRSMLSGVGVAKALVYGDALRTVAPVAAEKNAITRRFVRPLDPDEESDAEAADPEQKPATAVDPKVAEVPSEEPSAETKIYLILVPGFTVMFVFFLINIMARSFIAERDQGTLRRLQLAPISSASILIGKTLPFYLTSVLQTVLLFVSGRVLFNMSWGPEPIYLIPVVLCTSLAATSLGLLLATSVRTDQQVSSYGTSLVMILGGISGCMFPRVWLPDLMKTISLATPHAWALEAFNAALTRSTVDQVMVFDCCAMLLAFSAVLFLCGWWRFRAAA